MNLITNMSIDDFDQLWERRTHSLEKDLSPFTAQQWAAMVEKAKRSAPIEAAPPKRAAPRRVFWGTGIAAACVAAALIGVGLRNSALQPASIDYCGQSVRFICNNQCNAQSTIAYFDNYLSNKAAL